MKKVVCPLLILSLVLFSTPLKADSYTPSVEEDEVQCTQQTGACDVTPGKVETAEPAPVIESQPVDQDTYTDVTPASTDEESSARTTRLRYIVLAVVATIVAITAMLLVNSNEGHKHK